MTSSSASEPTDGLAVRLTRRHTLFGWWSLVLFLGMGLALEGLHALKAPFYLDPGHTLRRELWTLAHAHGTLVALVNIVFALSLAGLAARLQAARIRLLSHLLLDGSVLLPLGFFLGGALATEHDPWIAVLLAPLGALCLVAAVAMTALAVTRSP